MPPSTRPWPSGGAQRGVREVVVVGGGTAGWMSALLTRAFLPGARVTVVESQETGILGVGEGTTPQFVTGFLDAVGIPVSRLVREAGATIKNCFKHTNWNGDGAAYYHPFADRVTPEPDIACLHPERAWSEAELAFPARACERNRVVLARRPTADIDPSADPLSHLQPRGAFALHFDAVRLAGCLAREGAARGIVRVEQTCVGFDQAADGSVSAVRLADGRALPCDLVFDCTGFARLIIGKLYQAPWRDASAILPCNRALPFFIKNNGPTLTYSESIAMRHGWLWVIPVQGRLGCGYVFDSRFVDDDAARAELVERFGPHIELPRAIDFSAGWSTRPWMHNCVAIGVSAGFLEPLEATSIWTSISALNQLFRVGLPLGDDRARTAFNQWFGTLHQRATDFVYLHYLGRRRDTPFWSTFRDRTLMPDAVQNALGEGGVREWFNDPHDRAGNPNPFNWASWMHVARGTGNLDREALARCWDYYGLWAGCDERAAAQRARIEAEVDRCLDHDDCLRLLGGGA